MNRRAVISSLLIGCTALLVCPVRVFPQQMHPPGPLTREQMEEFLRTARIIRKRRIPIGVTNPLRATLTDGRLTHDAHIQTVNIRKAVYQTPQGNEVNFTDSYKYNIAAYRLDKILDLGMVPVSVERKVAGDWVAVRWWVDGVLMTGTEQYRKKIPPPDPALWGKQIYRMRVFDQLIYNVDRNLGNLLITKDWQLWMIDHTRAFRLNKTLKKPKILFRCDRRLLTAMRKLTYETLAIELRPYLIKRQIKALLARRDRIVEFFDRAIAERGEEGVLYDSPP